MLEPDDYDRGTTSGTTARLFSAIATVADP